MHDLTVACVYWEGNFRKRNFAPGWALRLKSMTERYIRSDFDFVVITNVPHKFPAHVRTIPLVEGLPGWWAKINLFDPLLDIGQRILYLDLDVLLINDLTPLIEYSTPAIRGCFSGKPTTKPDDMGQVIRYNSSVMLWDRGQLSDVYTEFSSSAISKFRGDQDWLGSVYPSLNLFPDKWIVKLRSLRKVNPLRTPGDIKVVLSMPWKNDVAAKKFKWVKEVWQ